MAYKKPTKLRDLGGRKSKGIKAERLQKAASSTGRKFYTDLKAKAKRANQRLVRLEKAGKKSPAYLAAQAKLEILGRQAGADIGRRFSETGKATYNEYQALSKILDEFLAQKTSKVKGYNEYINKVWESAIRSDKVAVDLEKAGITKEQWFEMWSALPDKKKRNFDSSEYIEALALYNIKNGEAVGGEFDVTAMIQDFESSQTLESAIDSLGISEHDYELAYEMGVL